MSETLNTIKQELPKTMGDMDSRLLYEDICQAVKEVETIIKERDEARAEIERLKILCAESIPLINRWQTLGNEQQTEIERLQTALTHEQEATNILLKENVALSKSVRDCYQIASSHEFGPDAAKTIRETFGLEIE